MIAIRGESHGGGVVVEVFPGKGARPVGENNVVPRETFLDRRWVGGHEDFTHAEFEQQDVTVSLHETVQGPVNWLFKQMEMA